MKDRGADLRIYQTVNDRSWAVRSTYASINSRDIYLEDRELLIDPQIPYIYLPARDFYLYSINIVKAQSTIRCTDNFNHDCYVR